MKPKTPTPAQQSAINAARRGTVQRCRYENHYPGGVTMTWCWVDLSRNKRVEERVIRALEKNGWAKVIRGELKPGAPDDPLRIAMGNWRLPDRLVLVDAAGTVEGA